MFKRSQMERKMADNIVSMAKEIDEFDNLMNIGEYFYRSGWSPSAILRLVMQQMTAQKAWDAENKNDYLMNVLCVKKPDPKDAANDLAEKASEVIECEAVPA